MHYGDALDQWKELKLSEVGIGSVAKLLERVRTAFGAESNLERVLRPYLLLREKTTFDELRASLDSSQVWREEFHKLKCRGFSYILDSTMDSYNERPGRRCKIHEDATLRFALVPGNDLYYPCAVRASLYNTRLNGNHYFKNNLPSIAFCFGKKKANAWYILVMQSDLGSEGPSCVRDHFRGWRHVLLANVLARARGEADRVFMCRAQDVERGCFSVPKNPARVSQRWTRIYDRTAEEWDMRLSKLEEPVNVQVYRGRDPVWCQHFYELPVKQYLLRSGDLCTAIL